MIILSKSHSRRRPAAPPPENKCKWSSGNARYLYVAKAKMPQPIVKERPRDKNGKYVKYLETDHTLLISSTERYKMYPGSGELDELIEALIDKYSKYEFAVSDIRFVAIFDQIEHKMYKYKG